MIVQDVRREEGKFAEALGYLRNHWEPLRLYLTDGRMPIDNNDVEQLMKQVPAPAEIPQAPSQTCRPSAWMDSPLGSRRASRRNPSAV